MVKQSLHDWQQQCLKGMTIIRHVIGRPEIRARTGQASLALAGLVVLAQLVAFTFHQGVLYQRTELLMRVDEALMEHHDSIDDLRREEQAHIDVLGSQIARLQAHIIRLDALGVVLSDLAQDDANSEFNFSSEPGLGGPMVGETVALTRSELMTSIHNLNHQVEDHQLRLEIFREMIQHNRLVAEIRPSEWPVRGGWVSSYYGSRKDPFHGRRAFHHGVDIASNARNSIYAAAAGIVSYVGREGNYGKSVRLTHANDHLTRYAHVSKILVTEGQFVERGQEIALVGSTGRSTGPHLHFEVLRHGKSVDPLKFISAHR